MQGCQQVFSKFAQFYTLFLLTALLYSEISCQRFSAKYA